MNPQPSTSKKVIHLSAIIGKLHEGHKRSLNVSYCTDTGAEFHSISDKLDKDIREKQNLKLQRPFPTLEEGSTLIIQINENHRLRKDKLIATINIKFDEIWQHLTTLANTSSTEQIHLQVQSVQEHVRLQLELVIVNPSKAACEELRSAKEKLEDMKSLLEHLSPARDLTDMAVKIGMLLGELHPIAKLVFGLVDVVYEQIKLQDQSHGQMRDLAAGMFEMVSYIKDVEKFATSEGLKKTMNTFYDLMTKAAELIENWLNSRINFFRVASNQGKLDDLKNRLNSYKDDFDRGLLIDLTLAFAKSEAGRELREKLLLHGKIDPDPSRRTEKCMEGTRLDLLRDVDIKINDLDGGNLIWIKGHPGVGKSAIASTIMAGQGQLGLYFRFDRNNSAATTTEALWRGIAYQLSCRYPSARNCIQEQLKDEKFDVSTPNIMDLFESLVEKPLSESEDISHNRPLVFVIDALDECGGLEGARSKDRSTLLQTLKHWPELPKRHKLIVTSRPEDDITRALSSVCISVNVPSGNNVDAQASTDIQTYLVDRLGTITEPYRYAQELPQDWHCQAAAKLAPRVAGIFIWAETVANFIRAGNPEGRFNQLISNEPELRGMEGLYALYANVLETSFGSAESSELVAVKAVMGVMVYARRPFRDEELAELPGVNKAMLRYIRTGLSSVIDQGNTLRFHHQSFIDFLIRPSTCPERFAVIENEQQRSILELCLKTMSTKLRFNICNLETSCLRNAEVPDIGTKVENGISPLLSYSCCFWADHLRRTPFDAELMDAVKKKVVYERLLYWFEVMSLLNEINKVIPILRIILDWSKTVDDSKFNDFIRDALRFVAAFGLPIAQSAPHIYISALPLAPKESLVAQHFLPKFSNTLTVVRGQPTHWPLSIFVTELLQDRIAYIAFLPPDGRTFVSVTEAGYFCICDSETGGLVSSPSRSAVALRIGKGRPVSCSPDGKHIAIAFTSKTVVGDRGTAPVGNWGATANDDWSAIAVDDWNTAAIGDQNATAVGDWDTAANGDWSTTAAEGWNTTAAGDQSTTAAGDWSTAVADGWNTTAIGDWTTTAVGGWNATTAGSRYVTAVGDPPEEEVGVFDVESGEMRLHFGSWIDAIAYSNHGQSIVSLTRQGDIDLQNTRNGGSDEKTLKRCAPTQPSLIEIGSHSRATFSSDGCYLASADRSGYVTIWDVNSRARFQGPFKPVPSGKISSLAFSSDGKFVVGISGGTIFIWSIGTGEITDSWTTNLSSTTDPMDELWLLVDPPRPCVIDPFVPVPQATWVPRAKPEEFAYCHERNLLVYSSAYPNSVTVWDTSTHNVILRQAYASYHGAPIISLSQDGRRLLLESPSREGAVMMWNLDRERIPSSTVQTTEDRAQGTLDVVISPSGETVVGGSYSRGIWFWDTASGEAKDPGFIESILCSRVTFSPDGSYIASADPVKAKISVWDARSGQAACFGPLQTGTTEAFEISYVRLLQSRDDIYLVVFRRTVVDSWNIQEVQDNVQPTTLTLKGASSILDVSPDGLTAVVNCGSETVCAYSWDTTTKQYLPSFEFPDVSSSSRVVYSANGKFLAAYGSEARIVRVWDMQSGCLCAISSQALPELHLTALSPDGQFIVVERNGDNVQPEMWNIRTGLRVSGPWCGHTENRVGGFAFSTDGTKFMSYAYTSGLETSTIRVWDTTDLRVIQSQASDEGFGDRSQIENGWAMCQDGGIAFWVPLEYRDDKQDRLWRPRNTAVIAIGNGKGTLQLDLTRFKYGKDWHKCINEGCL